MMKLTKYFTTAGLTLCGLWSFAQTTNIPVDPLTGKLSLTIPITEVSEGSLNVPVFLRYLSGGVRVNDTESSAGMSWELQAGGAVVREVRGLPDDYEGTGADTRKGWMSTGISSSVQNWTPTANDNLSDCTDEEADYDFIYDRGYTNDTEPDLFAFYAPGLSGQFVLDSITPRLIPYQDLTVNLTRNANGAIINFKIVTNQGVEYLFSTIQSTTRQASKVITQPEPPYFTTRYEQYKDAVTFTDSWWLTSITSPEGNDIAFGYQNFSPDPSEEKIDYYANDANNTKVNLYTVTDQTTLKLVNSITTSLAKIDLFWEEDRVEDIILTDQIFLDVKNYHFEYIRTIDASGPNPSPTDRYFLKHIIQENNCVTYPSYSFKYYGLTESSGGSTVSLPFLTGTKKDYWGYANSNTEATTEAPTIYESVSLTDGERYRITTRPGAMPINGGNRAPTTDINIVNAASLEKVEYPTGSDATIEYEPNQYYDTYTSSNVTGGGIRVKKVKMGSVEHDSEDVVTEYDYTTNGTISSGKIVYRPVLAFSNGDSVIRTEHNLGPDSYILYSHATVKQSGRGKTVYDFFVPAAYPDNSTSDWSATKSKIARASSICSSVGNQYNGTYSYPFAPNTNYDFERGLPQFIRDYSETNTLLMERQFTYQRIPSTATSIKGLRFEKQSKGSYSNYLYGRYTLLTNTDKVVATETVRRADEVTSANKIETSTTYVYNPTHNLLDSVTTTNSDGITYATKYRYAKDMSVNDLATNPESIGTYKLNTSNRGGTLLETIQSRKEGSTETVIGASLTLYKEYGTKVLPYKQLSFPQTSSFTETTGNGTNLVVDTDYISTTEIDAYSATGFVLSAKDHRENKSGAHFGFSEQMPFATISNAYADEVVYTGFESTTPYSLTANAGVASLSESWVGKLSFPMTTTTILSRTDVAKGSNLYKASCWVKGTVAANIDFKVKNSSTLVATGTVNYGSGDVNEWKYLETTLDITSANSTFTLEVSSSSAISIDEIRFHPFDAEVTTYSYDILNGRSAQANNRGDILFTEYDILGRPHILRNRKKDIVQLKEYRFKREATPIFSSSFSGSNFSQGSSTQLLSASNCSTGLTYKWYINGSYYSTGYLTNGDTQNYLNYTPSTTGNLTIKLVVEHTTGIYSETEKSYCVGHPNLGLSVTYDSDGTNQPNNPLDPDEWNNCFGGVKTFTATASGGCGSSYTYKWFIETSLNGTWQIGSASQITVDVTQQFPNGATSQYYEIWCEVSMNCPGDSQCPATTPSKTGARIPVTQVSDPPGGCI